MGVEAKRTYAIKKIANSVGDFSPSILLISCLASSTNLNVINLYSKHWKPIVSCYKGITFLKNDTITISFLSVYVSGGEEGWKMYINRTKGEEGLVETYKSVQGGRWVKNRQIWANVLFKWPPSKIPIAKNYIWNLCKNCELSYGVNSLSINELKDAFFSLNVNKSPGYDEISFNVVKKYFGELYTILQNLYLTFHWKKDLPWGLENC